MSYKIIQWATGKMGTCCLRAILEHDDLELVGARVYGNEKVGRDVGEIAGGEALGVIATDDIEHILALDADLVVHAARLQVPYSYHNSDICRLLESGKNVISINGHTYPQHWGSEYVEKIEAACQRGNSTFFGTGLNPGFISEKLLAVASGICTRIDSITISEVLQCNFIDDPLYAFDILGFGSEIGVLEPNDESWAPAAMINGLYKEVVHELVDRLGFTLERVETEHKMMPATSDIEIPAGIIKKGTNAHIRWCWHGMVDGKRFFTMIINWIMETGHLEDPNFNLWDVSINGLPNLDFSLNLSLPENYPRTSNDEYHDVEVSIGVGVAGSVINSIPAVCAAPPGIYRVPVAHHFRN